MTRVNWHPGEVNPSIPQFTSPTMDEDMRNCELRLAFKWDPNFKDTAPPSPPLILGKVGHKLMELATNGTFDDQPNDSVGTVLTDVWNDLIQKEISGAEKTGYKLPPANQWNYISMKRRKVILECEQIVKSRRQSTPQSQGISNSVKYLAEHTISAFDGRIRGKVDLIKIDGNEITILDYKTGKVLEENLDSGDIEIKESYKNQLLLYAAMYRDKEGIWPTRLLLQEHEIEYGPNDAQAIATKAIERLSRFQANITKRQFRPDPSTDNCLWCDYKSACWEFLNSATPEWFSTGRVFMIAWLNAIDEHSRHASIEYLGGNEKPGIFRVVDLPLGIIHEIQGHIGKKISFSNLERRSGGSDLLFKWDSTCWLW